MKKFGQLQINKFFTISCLSKKNGVVKIVGELFRQPFTYLDVNNQILQVFHSKPIEICIRLVHFNSINIFFRMDVFAKQINRFGSAVLDSDRGPQSCLFQMKLVFLFLPLLNQNKDHLAYFQFYRINNVPETVQLLSASEAAAFHPLVAASPVPSPSCAF